MSKTTFLLEDPESTSFISELKHLKYLTREQKKQYLFANLAEDLRSRSYSVPPAVERLFKAMDVRNEGRITSTELQHAFQTFQGRHFSDATCKFVVRLFDLDKNGGLDVREFETLYYYIKQWINAFNTYDREKSGFLDDHELDYALRSLDIHFSPEFIRFLITKNNPKAKRLSLDQYIVTCIQIQKFTDEFKRRDLTFSGRIDIEYEDFLEMIMKCL